MIQVQLKLRLKPKQETILNEWLLILTRVWNWAIRKIELDGKDGIYYTKKEFQNLLANHGKKLGIPSHTLQGMLIVAWESWKRCFKKLAKKPATKKAKKAAKKVVAKKAAPKRKKAAKKAVAAPAAAPKKRRKKAVAAK